MSDEGDTVASMNMGDSNHPNHWGPPAATPPPRRILQEHPLPPSPQPRRHLWRWAVLAVLVVACGVLVVLATGVAGGVTSTVGAPSI